MSELKRWRVCVTYRTEEGYAEVETDLEELEDLHDLVETGPHFDTVVGIRVIRINHVDDEFLTIERAERL